MPYRCNQHWGTFLWGFIHTECIVDQVDQVRPVAVQKALEHLEPLVHVIPCHHCQKEYRLWFSKLKNEYKYQDNMVMFYWSVDFHNAINVKLGKQVVSYEQALSKWTKVI